MSMKKVKKKIKWFRQVANNSRGRRNLRQENNRSSVSSIPAGTIEEMAFFVQLFCQFKLMIVH